jgi:hypothetical protein
MPASVNQNKKIKKNQTQPGLDLDLGRSQQHHDAAAASWIWTP